jgi:hypothetical protein
MRLLVGFIALLAFGCSAAPLPHSHDSPEALARAVLKAIEERDAGALDALALNKQEFTEHVWPELPAARPERNLSADFVWGDLHQKSNVTLRDTLTAHGGNRYEFVRIAFLGDTTTYGSFRVRRESELTVKDPKGASRQIRVFGSMLEKNGRYKVFSYVVDD